MVLRNREYVSESEKEEESENEEEEDGTPDGALLMIWRLLVHQLKTAEENQ
jgi:hypothetical protein